MHAFAKFIRTYYIHDNANLEQRISDIFIMFGMLMSATAFIISMMLKMDISSNLPSLFTALLCLAIPLIAKEDTTFLVNLALIYLVFLYFPYMFFISGGLNSTMPMYFIVALFYLTFAFHNPWRILIIISSFLLYASLFILAVRFPELVTSYPNELSRLTDFCISLIFAGIITVATALSIKGIYDVERNNVSSLLYQLQEKNDALLALSIRDPLTDCYNRRYLMECMESEITTHLNNQLPLCVLMLDLDLFKKINDTYGHAAGDEVLKLTADNIRSTLRQDDILARYGGEEFTVLLPNCNLENGEMIAERIRSNIADIRYRRSIQFTISVGVTVLEPEDTVELLLEKADKNLYHAKHNGRNQVVSNKA